MIKIKCFIDKIFKRNDIKELQEVIKDYRNRIETLKRIIEKQNKDMERLRELFSDVRD